MECIRYACVTQADSISACNDELLQEAKERVEELQEEKAQCKARLEDTFCELDELETKVVM